MENLRRGHVDVDVEKRVDALRRVEAKTREADAEAETWKPGLGSRDAEAANSDADADTNAGG
eukprot:1349311-Amorphochlora_amoeboformis.AAC.1